jgi:hypothetical protein
LAQLESVENLALAAWDIWSSSPEGLVDIFINT